MTDIPFFILRNLSIEYTQLNLQSFTKCLRQTIFFMWNSAVSISAFKRVLLVLRNKSFREEEWSLGNESRKFSWYFLISLNHKSSVAQQPVRQLLHASLLLIIALHFTCSEMKVCSTTKKSRKVSLIV